MKRTLTLVLVLALMLSLVFPTIALAKKGGVPANGKSVGNAAVAASEDTEPTEDPADVPESGKDKAKDKQKGKGGSTESGDVDPSDEASGTAPAKRTGVENALSRLQRNLERMQTQLEAGKRTGLPEGLQSAIAKFMSWLGIDPAAEAENTDEGSDETSGTVEPEPVDDADDEAAGTDTTQDPPADE
jgi:hypothetical protein